MLSTLLAKIQQAILTLRFSILSVFIILFVTSMIAVIAVTSIRFDKTVYYISHHLLNDASESVLHEIEEDALKPIKTLLAVSKELIEYNIVYQTSLTEIGSYTNHLLKTQSLKIVNSVFWADEAGNYAVSEKLPNDKIISSFVYREKNKETAKPAVWNKKEQIVPIKPLEEKQFDPRTLVWYKTAKAEKKTIVSDVYSYQLDKEKVLGIAVATPVYANTGALLGVFAMNVRIDLLRDAIQHADVTKHSIVYIVKDNGEVLAYPHVPQYLHDKLMTVDGLENPLVLFSFNHFRKTGSDEFCFNFAGNHYYSSYKPLSCIGTERWWIGVIVPANDFIGDLKRTNILTLEISFLVLLLGVIIYSYLITRVVQPIKQMVEETKRIKDFQLDQPFYTGSHIKEVVLLADALNAMKKGLRSFKKYVPDSLVRQIVQATNEAAQGGIKKEIVVLFTDIKDFTTISEYIDPKILMSHLCEYFDELSKIILHEHGVIDKYIGDSVMACWGMLSYEPNSCQLAASAALTCAKRLTVLNNAWAVRGLPMLPTRFGLHVGDAIVGNIGSTERLNYTAIGDTINTASRLENINKLYGTTIIISEAVKQSLPDHFITRFVDRVVVKGRTTSLSIYELMAMDLLSMKFDIAAYRTSFDLGFSAYTEQRWPEAIDYFIDCTRIFPEDTLAPVFISRCERFQLIPPDDAWDGAWHIIA